MKAMTQDRKFALRRALTTAPSGAIRVAGTPAADIRAVDIQAVVIPVAAILAEGLGADLGTLGTEDSSPAAATSKTTQECNL